MAAGTKIVAIMNVIPPSIAASLRSNTFGAMVLRPLVNRLVPEAPTPIVVRSGLGKGLRLLIYPRSEKYYWSGTHETAVQQAVASILRPGMRFWDVGAHIGFFTLLGSRFVGDSGQVHSFEPMPRNRQRLAASIGMNDLENITVHDVALSATGGEAVLHAHKSSTMWTLMRERGEEQGLCVRCCTLDELARSVAPPHLIKVDVEGAEVDVLRGGLGLLSSARPRLIIEFSDDTLLAEARSLLPSYTFERLAAHHWLLR